MKETDGREHPRESSNDGSKGKETKKFDDWERRVWFAFALLGCIGLLVFLATTAQLYWQKGTATDFWDLATAVFGFFGTLMTAGAAFATAAAVISYFSVNGKLREARSSLKKFKAIDQERKKIEGNIKEIDEYKSIMQNLEEHNSTETYQSSSIAAAEKILESPHANLEARLKARAIIREEKLESEFKEPKALTSEEQWNELILGRSDISSAWKILFLSAPQEAEQHTLNYAVALFNQAIAIQLYGYWLQQQALIPQALENWREAGKKYALTLKIKSDTYEAANNWGNVLNRQAHAVADENLSEARRLWQQAGEKYDLTLKIKSDSHEAAYNWGVALDAEAHALADENLPEARRLWQQAAEKYASALKIKSDKHEAAYSWGFSLDTEAHALADENLLEARRLWQQAAEKYALTLKIKSDTHKAEEKWWNILKRESKYIDANQIENFWSKKLDQVLELQKESPAHQNSAVIQDLIEKIRNQLKSKSS